MKRFAPRFRRSLALVLLALPLLALPLFAQPRLTQEAPVEVLTESYSDGQTKTEREVVRDGDGYPVNHGMYRAWYENGQLATEGKFKEGVRVGKWETFHANGAMASTGIYRRGFRIQKWVYRDENGKRQSDSGKYTPVFDEYENGRRKSAGEYRGKPKHGRWVWWYENGQIACEGRYRIDKRDGQWTWYRPDGSLRFQGNYEKHGREGNWTYWHANGYADPEFFSGLYRKGKRIGPHAELSPALPELDLSQLPLPTPVGVLTIQDTESLETSVRRYAEKTRPSDADRLAEWEHMAIPSILGYLRRSGLRDATSNLYGSRLNATSLRQASGGHSLGWNEKETPLAFADNRRTYLRWLSLWELTHNDEAFWSTSRKIDGMTNGAYLDWLAETIEIGTFAPSNAGTSAAVEHVAIPFDELRTRHGGRGTKKTLDAAIAWLIAHQGSKGSWEAHDYPRYCDPKDPCIGRGHASLNTGVTGLALLALVGAGNTLDHSEHPGGAEAVQRAVDFLRRDFDARSGLIGEPQTHDHIYGHAIGTIALCEISHGRNDPLLNKIVRSCLETIERRRNPDGAWRYDAAIDKSDTSVTAWMMTALASGKHHGFEVSSEALKKALPFLDKMNDPETGRIGYDAPGALSSRTIANEDYERDVGEAMTAAGLWSRLLAGASKDDSTSQRNVALLLEKLPQWQHETLGNDMYYWYYGTYAMFQMGGKSWKTWNAALLQTLLPSQISTGHAKGSWDPVGPWGYSGGRIYSTALAALCLEVYFRYPPGFGE